MNKVRQEFHKIYDHLDKILLLFFILFAAMEFVWIPLNSWVSEGLLAMTGYAYLSPTNLFQVLTANPIATGLFIVLFLANILVAYLEIALLFVGVSTFLGQEVTHLPDYLRAVRQQMGMVVRNISLPKVIFLLFYSVILLPFLRKILNIYYFNKLLIPQFIMDYLMKNIWIAILFLLVAVLFFWLAARWMYALPQIFLKQVGLKEALTFSWHRTKQGQWSSLLKLFWTVTLPVLVLNLVGNAIYLAQLAADSYARPVALVVGVLLYILFKLTYYGTIALFMTMLVTMVTGKDLPATPRKRLRHRLRLTILLVSSLYFGVEGAILLYIPYEELPVTISHRGVDNENGVQNTLPALELTARLHPDYIEMDVQETKDGQFIVMHDTDLRALTGNPGGTHDYSLAELTAMTASENGQSAPVLSFDAYLTKAEELGQKLLVEIKVTPQDSPDMAQRFLKQYGSHFLTFGHQIQSLDYPTIQAVKKYNSQIVSYFILPFNSIYPTTVADGYTMEYSSLDTSFVLKSWLYQKQVYAWTPNDEESIKETALLEVDGIITDQLELLQEINAEIRNDRRYADLLWLQITSTLYRL